MFWSVLPVAVYWTVCVGCYLTGLDTEANMRNSKNQVSVRQTINRVATLHVLQIIVTLPSEMGLTGEPIHDFRPRYILLGMLLLDTAEYFCHRLYHTHPLLYRHVHKTHHELKTPWSFGALYNSYVEAVITGACVSLIMRLCNLSVAETSCVYTLGNVATIMDHVAYFDIKFSLFGKGAYHRYHHEVDVHKNFQQPFFTFWDTLLNTKANTTGSEALKTRLKLDRVNPMKQ